MRSPDILIGGKRTSKLAAGNTQRFTGKDAVESEFKARIRIALDGAALPIIAGCREGESRHACLDSRGTAIDGCVGINSP
jgi:hypothetical protein